MAARFDAVLFDAGGVLVLPDPTVLGPLLVPYGGTTEIEVHRRAHYLAMARKSHAAAGERDWLVYDETYVRQVGVADEFVEHAIAVFAHTRSMVWRWPIPETVEGLTALAAVGVPMGVVSNAFGQIEEVLGIVGICQVGDGDGVAMRVIVDSHVVGVAKPDPRIFDFATPHFEEFDRSRIAYVGDSITMDVDGARAAGLHPILIDPYDDHEGADFDRVRSVSDLADELI